MVLIIDMLRVCLFGEGRPELVEPTTAHHPAKTGNQCLPPPSLPPVLPAPQVPTSSERTLPTSHDRRGAGSKSPQRPRQGGRASPRHRRSTPPRRPIAKPSPGRRDISTKKATPPRLGSDATAPLPTGEPKSQFNRDIVLLQRQYDELCAKMHSLTTKRAPDLQQRPLQRQNQTCFRTHREREPNASRTNAAMLTITPQPRETLTPAFSTHTRDH